MFSSRGNAIENLAIQRLVLLNQYIIELMIDFYLIDVPSDQDSLILYKIIDKI